MSVVNRGDPYVAEVAATVSRVMEHELIQERNPHRLVWQSQVGPRAWMGMQTGEALKGLARLGKKDAVLVPIAFTSDHIETLYELDLEYVKEAEEVRAFISFVVVFFIRRELTYHPSPLQLGMQVARAESLNDSPVFIRALADIVSSHLRDCTSGIRGPTSPQMLLRCPGCTSSTCGRQKAWFAKGGDSSIPDGPMEAALT
jgi:protoporphyrin/coproporphyrin ferrochelatase